MTAEPEPWRWRSFAPHVLALLALALVLLLAVPRPPAEAPASRTSPKRLVFAEEFDGDRVDTSTWAGHSSALSDHGRGNLKNGQLEWNQLANCSVRGGRLVMTAERESTTSPSGTTYSWTSCLLTSTPSFSFRYGYLEERSQFPAEKGFWPAFWTWQVAGVDAWVETDVYEFYSDNPRRIYVSQRSGGRGECGAVQLDFDPSQAMHTYAADITPHGTTFFVDGTEVCRVAGTQPELTNIITNLAVYAELPPASSTRRAEKYVDHIRVYR